MTPGNYHKNENRSRIMIVSLMTFAFLLIVLLIPTARASVFTDAMSNAGNTFGGWLNSYASSDAPGFLDFLIFSVIFFSLCWVGFSQVFKDAKAANIALSISLGFALSVALVYGGKFTVKKLLPFAAVILFLLAIVLIYSLLKKFVFTKDTIVSKVLSVIVAILISCALLYLAWSFICSGSNCENNAFMKKIFGSESIVGKLFKDVGSINVAPIPKPTPSTPAGTPTPTKPGGKTPAGGAAPGTQQANATMAATQGMLKYVNYPLYALLLISVIIGAWLLFRNRSRIGPEWKSWRNRMCRLSCQTSCWAKRMSAIFSRPSNSSIRKRNASW